MGTRTFVVGMAVVSLLAACGAAGGDIDRSGFEELEDSGSGGQATTPTDGGSGPVTPADTGTTEPLPDGASDAPIDVAPSGNPVGFPCAQAEDCASGECKPVLAGGTSSLCVKPCTAQSDCADNFFCDPATPGATTGFCVPRSPAHCKTCNTSSECGALSETCGVAAGDTVKACHVDCTIAGAAACPPDYTCEATTLDGDPAKVCRPAAPLSCLDALGGYCDRVATPQTCSRSNGAGTCAGQRACLAASTRYDSCGASAPVCKMTCSATDPAGCNTLYCPAATSGPENCGTCGNACPGIGTTKANVGCNQPNCTFSCQGENYDVDNDPANGCEIADSTAGNHSNNTASNVGNIACYDDVVVSISGRLPSDSRGHTNPDVAGFVTATGSAPDFHKIRATGQSSIINPCANNVDLELTLAGSNFRGCYRLHVETNKNTYDCDTDATTGKCRINPSGNSKYDDNTDIYVVVSKRNVAGCLAAQRDNPSYTIRGHL